MPKQPPPPSPWTAGRIVSLASWIVVLSALPVAARVNWNRPWVLCGLAGFYIAVAFLLRSRLVIGTLAGLLFGLILVDGNWRNKSEMYRLWQPVWSIGVGVTIGTIIGFLWDHAATLAEKPASRPKKKR